MAEQRISIEELIALRDGLQTTGNFRRLLASDIEAIKELAEARLFALLMSIASSDADLRSREIPDPETLVRYLTNTLPSADVRRVEAAVRGNPEALEFLIALKDALFRPDVWQRDPAPGPPAPTTRIEVGRVQVAVLGGSVHLRRAPPPEDFEVRRSVAAAMGLEANLDGPYLLGDTDLEAPQVSPEDQLFELLSEIERRISELKGTVEWLSAELSRGIKAKQTPDVAVRSAVRFLRQQLQSIDSQLPEMESLAGQLDPRSAANVIRRELERVRAEAERRAAAARAARRDPRLDWPTQLTLTHPDLEIDLHSINTDPTPMIGITVRPMQGAPSATPEATLVVPGKRFVALTPDLDGTFKAPPPSPGTPSLLLFDTDQTYSIRLDPA
jgi:hypothetical protein